MKIYRTSNDAKLGYGIFIVVLIALAGYLIYHCREGGPIHLILHVFFAIGLLVFAWSINYAISKEYVVLGDASLTIRTVTSKKIVPFGDILCYRTQYYRGNISVYLRLRSTGKEVVFSNTIEDFQELYDWVKKHFLDENNIYDQVKITEMQVEDRSRGAAGK